LNRAFVVNCTAWSRPRCHRLSVSTFVTNSWLVAVAGLGDVGWAFAQAMSLSGTWSFHLISRTLRLDRSIGSFSRLELMGCFARFLFLASGLGGSAFLCCGSSSGTNTQGQVSWSSHLCTGSRLPAWSRSPTWKCWTARQLFWLACAAKRGEESEQSRSGQLRPEHLRSL
jgi:hypothetical protein